MQLPKAEILVYLIILAKLDGEGTKALIVLRVVWF